MNHDKYYAAQAADDAFQAELVRQFGEDKAGDARYYPELFDDATKRAAKAFHAAVFDHLRTMRA